MIGALRKISRSAAAMAGFAGEVAVFLMFAHLSLDMVMRFVAGTSPDGMPETVSRLYMVMAIFLPLAAVQRSGQQIEVTFFMERMRGKLARIPDILSPLITAAVSALLTWLSFGVAFAATIRGEYIMLISANLPIWPARWAVVLGFGMLSIVALEQALSAIFAPDQKNAQG